MLEIHKALKSNSVTTKRAVLNLGVLSAVSLIGLVIKSKSPPIKGAVLESSLIVKSIGSVTKIRAIKRACAFKSEATAIKGGVIGSAKLFIESECPPIPFRPAKSGVLFKSETAFCIAKRRIRSVSRPFKRIARYQKWSN
ncbi:hypothetical protein ACKRAS_02595 [Helicobacter pylori]